MARFTLPRDIYHGNGSLEVLKTLKGKKAVVVVGGGSMKRFGFLEKVENYLKEVMYYWDVDYVLTMPIAYRDIQLNDKNRAIINRKADKFVLELNSRKVHEPSFKSILMYNVWRAMSINGNGVGIADCKYWSNEKLKETNFYPGIPIGFVKRTFGKFIFSRFHKK